MKISQNFVAFSEYMNFIISTTRDQNQPNYLTQNSEFRSQEEFKTYTFASIHPVVYKIVLHLTNIHLKDLEWLQNVYYEKIFNRMCTLIVVRAYY